jgi:release factor glutamine methyltransferase
VPATAGEALQAARERLAVTSQNPRRDAELLLASVLGCDTVTLFAHPEQVLSTEQAKRFESFVTRRTASEPIQYILGEQEFFGLPFAVTPDVLIPRPETEHLVETALQCIDPQATTRILDVGTGSGAIAIALACNLPNAHVTATDLSPSALAVAQNNARRHGVAARMAFRHSDLLQVFAGACFDVIVSNPPYIADSEMLEPQVANYEPHAALYSGPSGLEIYQRLIPQAHAALNTNGWLLLEIGYGQSGKIRELLNNWSDVHFIDDLQGIPRVAVARRYNPKV